MGRAARQTGAGHAGGAERGAQGDGAAGRGRWVGVGGRVGALGGLSRGE